MPKRSKRYEFFDKLEVNQDTYLEEMPEIGLITTGGLEDPRPSIKIKSGQVVEMDEKPLDEFDIIDHFIARYSIDLTIAEESMKMDSIEFAKMIVDINVPRSKIVKYAAGLILEFKFKSKRAIISEREESIKRLTRELNEAYEREEKLEKELDLWKEKYFAQR